MLEVLNHLSIKNLIILILYENAIRLLKFKRGTGQFAICLKNEILIIVPEMNTSRKAMKCSTCCSIVRYALKMNRFQELFVKYFMNKKKRKKLSQLTRDAAELQDSYVK